MAIFKLISTFEEITQHSVALPNTSQELGSAIFCSSTKINVTVNPNLLVFFPSSFFCWPEKQTVCIVYLDVV